MFIKVKTFRLYGLAIPNLDSDGKPMLVPYKDKYKVMYLPKRTLLESIDSFSIPPNMDNNVWENDIITNLSMGEYLALSSKLASMGMMFNKRTNSYTLGEKIVNNV